MNITSLNGSRVLARTGIGFSFGQDVEEFKILEVSPSGEWVKLLNLNGRRFWKPVKLMVLVEVLKELHNESKPEE